MLTDICVIRLISYPKTKLGTWNPGFVLTSLHCIAWFNHSFTTHSQSIIASNRLHSTCSRWLIGSVTQWAGRNQIFFPTFKVDCQRYQSHQKLIGFVSHNKCSICVGCRVMTQSKKDVTATYLNNYSLTDTERQKGSMIVTSKDNMCLIDKPLSHRKGWSSIHFTSESN